MKALFFDNYSWCNYGYFMNVLSFSREHVYTETSLNISCRGIHHVSFKSEHKYIKCKQIMKGERQTIVADEVITFTIDFDGKKL